MPIFNFPLLFYTFTVNQDNFWWSQFSLICCCLYFKCYIVCCYKNEQFRIEWKRSAFSPSLPAHFLEFSLECTCPGIFSAVKVQWNLSLQILLFLAFSLVLSSIFLCQCIFTCFFSITAEFSVSRIFHPSFSWFPIDRQVCSF